MLVQHNRSAGRGRRLQGHRRVGELVVGGERSRVRNVQGVTDIECRDVAVTGHEGGHDNVVAQDLKCRVGDDGGDEWCE